MKKIRKIRILDLCFEVSLPFVDDGHSIAFLEVQVIILSFIKVVQRPYDYLR